MSLAAALISLAVALLRWATSLNTPEAVTARLLLKAHKAIEKKKTDAQKAVADALADLDADGVSEHTHFRD